ncbi:Bidirectional sugar transporter SWEET5, partial [Bienertia sinuspersici]
MALEAIFMPIAIFLTIFYFNTTISRAFFIRIPCGIFCIVMYASPLRIMCKVIKTMSVRHIPFWLLVGNLANGVIENI